MAVGLPPEERLLLAAARWLVRGRAGGDDPEPPALDLERLAALAAAHGMLPVLGRYTASRPALAGVARAALSPGRVPHVRDALALTAELRELAPALAEAGARVLCFKGPVLAQQAYGDVALRQYADLDLLAAPGGTDAALAALAARGYVPGFPVRDWRALRRDGHHLLLRRDPAVVELHWRVNKRLMGFREDVGELFARAGTVAVHGVAVAAPHPEDHLLVVSMHALRGLWRMLEWTLSAALLARGVEHAAWPGVLARAERWGCRRALLVTLLLARDLAGLALPAAVEAAAMGDRVAVAAAAEARARTFGPRRSRIEYYRQQLRLRRGEGTRLRFALGALFWSGPEVAAAPPGRAAAPGLPRLLRLVRRVREHRAALRLQAGTARRSDPLP